MQCIVKFCTELALDVATPSACVMADELFPALKGVERSEMIERLTEFNLTMISAYFEFTQGTHHVLLHAKGA